MLAAATLAASHRSQAAPDLAAHHLLTLAAMAAQRLISLRLPTGAVRPVSCYFLSLVGSGEGRSAAEHLCLEPVRFWQQRFSPGAGGGEPRRVIINLTCDPNEPRTPKNCIDITMPPQPPRHPVRARPVQEKPFECDQVFLSPLRSGITDRYDRYARFGRRAGLFSAVTADVLTPSCARRNEADSLSALWDGVVVAGVAGEESVRHAPRLSIHLVATPGEGTALLRAPELAHSGLRGRLLAVAPASRIGARRFAPGDGSPPADLHALHARLTELFTGQATAETRILPMDGDAEDLWFAFAHECETAMAGGGPFAAIRALAGHLAEHAARLAAIIALVEDAALAVITAPMLARGIALARFYADEALRLVDWGEAALEKQPLAALHSWLDRNYAGQTIRLREVYWKGPAAMRSPRAARAAMREMEALGIAVPQPREGNSGDRWKIHARDACDLPHTAA